MAGSDRKRDLQIIEDREHGEDCPMTEVIALSRENKKLLEQHVKEFSDHRAEAKVAMAKIDVIHRQSTAMEKHAENLNALPGIYEVLKGIKDDLIAPATGRKQMPVSIAMAVIILLGALLILDHVKSSNKEISLTPNGLVIKESPEKQGEKKINEPVK